jgi:serine/threonine protein kinase
MATSDGMRPPQHGAAGVQSQGDGVAVAGGSQGDSGSAAPVGGASSSSPPVGASASQTSSTAANVDKWKGRKVKRFKLIDELGEGAMGRVFLAEDTVLKRHVALKLLPAKHRDGRPNQRTERLVREARSAASLEHPNAVHIYEIDQSGGVHYIAMELVEGGNLEKLVEMSGPMEIERACQLIAEAAEALAHAHVRGIIHRDVKPANLLLTRSGRCKVCDFGLALFDEELDADGRTKCVGTPYYIAPEVAQGKGATAASDLYGLGCTLFFLLTGRAPFAGTSARELMKAHVTQPLPDLRHWRQDVPDRLVMAIEQACAKDPARRFESTAHFAALMRTFTIPTGNNGNSSHHGGGPANASFHGGPNASRSSMPGFSSSGPGSGSGSGGIEIGMPPISAAQLEAILPAAALQANARRKQTVVTAAIWTGMGTIAASILIGLGVWMARAGQQPAAPAASTAGEMTIKPDAASASASAAGAAKTTSSGKSANGSSTATPATPAPSPAVSPAPALAPNAASAAAASAAAGDALVNGSIEENDVDDGLAGWFIHDRFKPQAQILTESGNRFLRLTNSDPAKTVFADQRIRIDPSWKALNVSARMRATNFKSGKTAAQDARVAFAFRDDKDVRIGNWPPVPSVKTDSPWVERTVTVDVPDGAKTMYIQLAIFNATGTVDFDDVKVIPQK